MTGCLGIINSDSLPLPNPIVLMTCLLKQPLLQVDYPSNAEDIIRLKYWCTFNPRRIFPGMHCFPQPNEMPCTSSRTASTSYCLGWKAWGCFDKLTDNESKRIRAHASQGWQTCSTRHPKETTYQTTEVHYGYSASLTNLWKVLIIEHILKHWSILPHSRRRVLTGRVSLRWSDNVSFVISSVWPYL